MSLSFDDLPARPSNYAGGIPDTGFLANLPERTELDADPEFEARSAPLPRHAAAAPQLAPLFTRPDSAAPPEGRAPGVVRRTTGGWRSRLRGAMSSAGAWLRGGWNRLGSLFRRRPAPRVGGLAAAMRAPHPLLSQPQQEGTGAFVEPENQRFGRWLRGEDGRVDEWAGARSLPYSMGAPPDTPDTPLDLGPAADLGPTPASSAGAQDAVAEADDPYDRPLRRGSFADADEQADRAARAEEARRAAMSGPTGYEKPGWAFHYLDHM